MAKRDGQRRPESTPFVPIKTEILATVVFPLAVTPSPRKNPTIILNHPPKRPGLGSGVEPFHHCHSYAIRKSCPQTGLVNLTEHD